MASLQRAAFPPSLRLHIAAAGPTRLIPTAAGALHPRRGPSRHAFSPRTPPVPSFPPFRLLRSFGVSLVLSLFLCHAGLLCAASAPVVDENAPVQVQSAMVMDLKRDNLLFEQNSRDRIPPASLTKILSLYVALDAVKAGKASLESMVPVSRRAATAGGARMGLIEGETVPLKELFLGMAVASGNDASTAVAEFIGGSEEEFVRLMNAKAKRLGMTDSVFANPHGLPAKEQWTSARDMMLLSRAYLLEHPEMLDYHNTHFMRHGQRIAYNRNPVLGNYPGGDGLKTGWIRKSGYNIVSTASRDGERILAVILGGPDPDTRACEALRLLEAGFASAKGGVRFEKALEAIPACTFQPDMRLTCREALAHWNIQPRAQRLAR
ncbi:MAG: D-alanyl-D-alanine carboxypeptidase, partial [Desulfovibrio sp.]|nr:D-alanyl-D-alanine carboxypeptidase [Desulfovibrio sp.]